MLRTTAVALVVMLAGITSIISSPASAGSEQVVYSFTGSSDGASPYAGLLNVNGTLYGVTLGGGNFLYGTIFSINPTTGLETVKYSFKNGGDGADPSAALINVGGTLYGTTIAGGDFGLGTVFSFNPKFGAESVLYSFKGGSDGSMPVASLLNVSGMLYGTTEAGGTGSCSSGCGTVFAVNVRTNAETVVYSFKGGSDGEQPEASLISVNGLLYGTTQRGGSLATNCIVGTIAGCGTIFAVNLQTSAETVVYYFKGNGDGAFPLASLLNVKGALYGTTESGGAYGLGTVFSVNPKAETETLVYAFKGGNGDGAYPLASLINASGVLYGTTYGGGLAVGGAANGFGTVFSIIPSTGVETVEYLFNGSPSDGQLPFSGLIKMGISLYGTTTSGGSGYVGGTVFSLTQ